MKTALKLIVIIALLMLSTPLGNNKKSLKAVQRSRQVRWKRLATPYLLY